MSTEGARWLKTSLTVLLCCKYMCRVCNLAPTLTVENHMRASETEPITLYLNPNAFTVGAKLFQNHVSAILLKKSQHSDQFLCYRTQKHNISEQMLKFGRLCVWFHTEAPFVPSPAHGFGYESGPHSSPRSHTLSQ